MKPIRHSYQKFGVETYYSQHGAGYQNPHWDQVRKLLLQNEKRIKYNRVLDLACGHGEVSRVLVEMGYENFVGCDPFTWAYYQEKMKANCLRWSFKDIIKGRLEGHFSSTICSFGMHLCPEKLLYPLVSELFEHCDQLVVITPHKRPALEKLDGVKLEFEDYSLTPKGKKVRLKSYRYGF